MFCVGSYGEKHGQAFIRPKFVTLYSTAESRAKFESKCELELHMYFPLVVRIVPFYSVLPRVGMCVSTFALKATC